MNSSEIAKLAGVSRSTVSRVINNYANVPPNTKRKVMDVIDRFGYIPNLSARSLAGKPSRIIGLFILESSKGDIVRESPFYSEFTVRIADSLQRLGYRLLVTIIRDETEREGIRAAYEQSLIAGGIFMGDIIPDKLLAWISSHGFYSALVNQQAQTAYDRVLIINTENYRGAYSAVSVLIGHGHRRIAHISDAQEKISVRERFKGYRDCLRDNGVAFDESLVVKGHMHHEESGYYAVKTLFSHDNKDLPTAVFSANDLMAFGAIRALRELGCEVPGDVSVIGYDNVAASRYCDPPLSTVAVSVERLALLTAENLIRAFETQSKTIPPIRLKEFELVLRGSISQQKSVATK